MAKAILDAIEQLEIYTTNKVQEWKEIMQRPSNSEEQDRVATAVWETYRDMANRIADLGELAEEVLNSEGYMNGMYEELLEKLRKNNRMSGWTHIDRLMDDAIKAIVALQQENNGWRERYDELDAGHSRLFKDFCKLQQEYLAVCQLLREDTVQAYHNPDDVDALRKARKALCKGISALKVHCKYFDNTPEEVQELAKAKTEGRLVEVVRCGECRHYNTTGCSDGCGWCENMDRGVFDEQYCSRGERREKE